MKRFLLTLSLALSLAGYGYYSVDFSISNFSGFANSVSNLTVAFTYPNGGVGTCVLSPTTGIQDSANYNVFWEKSFTGGALNCRGSGGSYTLSAKLFPGYKQVTFACGAKNDSGTYDADQGTKTFTVADGKTTAIPSFNQYWITCITNMVVTPCTYTLTYDANGGTVSPSSKTVTYDSQYGTLATATRTGYTFKQWNFKGTSTKVSATDTVKILTSTNLVAQWSPITYQIAFAANGGTGTMSKLTSCVYDQEVTLPACTFTREHYNFSCWSNTVTAVTYANQAKVKNLVSTQDAVATLTAVWTPKTYTVRYHSNYGADTKTTSMVTWGEVFNLKGSMTRQGYTFKGWSESALSANGKWAGAEEINSSTLTFDEDGVCDLYGVWKAHTYKVTFNANGGTGEMDNAEDRYTDDGVALPNCTFTRAGYVFAGWGLKKNDKTASFDEGSTANITMDDATVTLYALWTPITYSVAFDKNSDLAEGTMSPMVLTYDAKTNLVANAFTRDGYDFNGWTNAVGTAFKDTQEVTNLTTVADATVTLYATWKAQSYTVTLNANGGGFESNGLATSNITVTVDEPWGTLPAVTNSNWKLVYDGWTTNANWSLGADDGIRVQVADLVPTPSKGLTTLYATWYKEDPLAQAVDATELDFEQTGASTGSWQKQNVADATNGNAAVACVSGINGAIVMSTQVVGPGTLTFRWKVASSVNTWPVEDVGSGWYDIYYIDEDGKKWTENAATVWKESTEKLVFAVNGAYKVGLAAGGFNDKSEDSHTFSTWTTRFSAFDSASSPTDFERWDAEPTWMEESVVIDSAEGVTNSVVWMLYTDCQKKGLGNRAWVDAVVWTPDAGGDAGEPEVPVAAEGAAAPIAIKSSADGSYSIQIAVGNGVKGCWYSVWQADEVTGPWTLVNDDQAVRQQAGDVAKGELKFSFSVTPNVERRFYKLRVTATQPQTK